MLERLIRFQQELKGNKGQTLQPLLPTIHGHNQEKENDNFETIDHQLIGNRYCGTYRSKSQKRNQIKSIRRAKIVGYSQLVDNYKNANRQSQQNPFKGQLLIKQMQTLNNSNNNNNTCEQQKKVIDDLKVKFKTLEAQPRSQRYQSCPKKSNFLDVEIKISPYHHQKNNCIDYYYII